MNETATCPACGGGSAESVYRIEQIPVHSTALLEDRTAAIAYPKRDLELTLCRDCGFVFNRLFDPVAAAYRQRFETSQHCSETFNSFAQALVREIALRCDLQPGRLVLEIGCGNGEFLSELCRFSGCDGVGIDPAYRNVRTGIERGTGKLSFIADTFGPQHLGHEAALVLCRHTLEHIGPVGEFVAMVRRMIGSRADVHVVFETPDASRVLAEGAFWDVYYEHAGYFTPGSHARLFRRNGFSIDELRLVYGGQYIVQYAKPAGAAREDRATIEDDLERTISLAKSFAEKARDQMLHWRGTLAKAMHSGERVALWGGGSKAVAFIEALDLADMAIVVDKNPLKQGRYLPGSGCQVRAPAELQPLRPSLVVAMNPIYCSEIVEDLAALGLPATVLALGA